MTTGAAVSDLEARRAAFIAAERARRVSEGDFSQTPEAVAARRPGEIPTGPFFVREEKSMMIAYLLWFFLGGFSAHRFYLNAYLSGAIQLFLVIGGLFILLGSAATKDVGTIPFAALMMLAGYVWVLLDLFLIPGLCRRASTGGRPGPAAAYVYN